MAFSTRTFFLFAGASIMGLSMRAEAYPGAKASDLKTQVKIVAACEKRTDEAELYYGYTSIPKDFVESGPCPKGASAVLMAAYRPATIEKADLSKTDVVYSGIRGQESHRAWIMTYSIGFVENNQARFVTEMNEADFQNHLASFRTASTELPVSVDVDYGVRAVTAIKRKFAPGDGEVQLTSACQHSKYDWQERTTVISVYGYSAGTGYRTLETCPEENAQVIFRKTIRDTSAIYFNSKESTWRKVYSYEVEIKSRYDVPLFKTPIHRATFEKAALDLRTSAIETPVSAMVNTTMRQFFWISPTVSPYKL